MSPWFEENDHGEERLDNLRAPSEVERQYTGGISAASTLAGAPAAVAGQRALAGGILSAVGPSRLAVRLVEEAAGRGRAGCSFIPVQAVRSDDLISCNHEERATAPAGELEMTLRDGRVLRFGLGVDAARGRGRCGTAPGGVSRCRR